MAVGNGDQCPTNADHGRMVVLRDGKQWCPNQEHDAERVPLREMHLVDRSTEDMATGDKVNPVPKPGARATTKAQRDQVAVKARATAPAAVAKETPLCLCGCGEHTKGGKFRPGHDARYHSAQRKLEEAAAEKAAKKSAKAAKAAPEAVTAAGVEAEEAE